MRYPNKRILKLKSRRKNYGNRKIYSSETDKEEYKNIYIIDLDCGDGNGSSNGIA